MMKNERVRRRMRRGAGDVRRQAKDVYVVGAEAVQYLVCIYRRSGRPLDGAVLAAADRVRRCTCRRSLHRAPALRLPGL